MFEVPSKGVGRLLTALGREVRVKGEKDAEEGMFRFSVSSRDKAKVVAICGCLCYNYKIIKEKGALLAVARALRRAGVAAGLVCSAVMIAVYPFFVTEVKFAGDDIAGVRDAVARSGVRKGAFLPSFGGDELERELLALDGVAFASVTKRGTHVTVEVRAERAEEHFVDIPTGAVTAKVTASVTRVVVTSGTAEVGYGDVVREGDVLIGAYVLSGEEKVPCPADGEVYGVTYRNHSRFFPDVVTEKVFGEVRRETRIAFGSRPPETPQSPFEDYVLEVSKVRNDLMIGYTLYTYTFTEVRAEERRNMLSDEEMRREAETELLLELPAGAKLMSVKSTSARGEGGVYVRVTAEAEERIN